MRPEWKCDDPRAVVVDAREMEHEGVPIIARETDSQNAEQTVGGVLRVSVDMNA